MVKSIYEAIGNVQKKVGELTKDSDNPYFDSKYVDHASLLRKIGPALEEENLVLTCAPNVVFGEPTINVRLDFVGTFDGGGWAGPTSIEGRYLLPKTDNPQKFASATTYARRYAVLCILNLPCVDDDANYASGKSAQAPGGVESVMARLKGNS